MDGAHAERVAEIKQEFSHEIEENDRRWNALKQQVLERRRFLIEVEPGADSKPVKPIVNEFLDAWNACSQEGIGEELRAQCQAGVRSNYWKGVAERYFKADFDLVLQQQKANPESDIESLAAKSHNERLLDEIKAQVAEIEGHKREFRESMNGMRETRVQLSENQRDQEIDAAERKRRAVWAAALQGFAQGMQNASASSNSSRSSPTAPGSSAYGGPSGCTSDFSCGMGNKCVKNYYNSTGVCMKAVNEYGGPSYEPPDLDSVGPNMPSKKSCTLGACPAGFRCDLNSGVCIR
jgi:hypothetical protein